MIFDNNSNVFVCLFVCSFIHMEKIKNKTSRNCMLPNINHQFLCESFRWKKRKPDKKKVKVYLYVDLKSKSLIHSSRNFVFFSSLKESLLYLSNFLSNYKQKNFLPLFSISLSGKIKFDFSFLPKSKLS